MTWPNLEPTAVTLEARLARHLAGFNRWRARIATHYPATLRGICVAIATVLIVVLVPVLSTVAPLWFASIFGILLALVISGLVATLLLIVLFDRSSNTCTCDECGGGGALR